MFAITSIVALCAVLLAVESRIIMVQEAPVKPEGISLKITLKEDRDASGRPIASIRLYMDDDLSTPAGEVSPAVATNEVIPDFDDRLGIGNGKCPIGSRWRGSSCWPVAG